MRKRESIWRMTSSGLLLNNNSSIITLYYGASSISSMLPEMSHRKTWHESKCQHEQLKAVWRQNVLSDVITGTGLWSLWRVGESRHIWLSSWRHNKSVLLYIRQGHFGTSCQNQLLPLGFEFLFAKHCEKCLWLVCSCIKNRVAYFFGNLVLQLTANISVRRVKLEF